MGPLSLQVRSGGVGTPRRGGAGSGSSPAAPAVIKFEKELGGAVPRLLGSILFLGSTRFGRTSLRKARSTLDVSSCRCALDDSSQDDSRRASELGALAGDPRGEWESIAGLRSPRRG